MRAAAIDLGDERTGIAFSDISGFLTGEAFVLEEWNEDRLCDKICALLTERNVAAVAVGHPLNMNGTQGDRAAKASAFARRLGERSGLPVTLWDERRTTVEARRILGESGKSAKKRRKNVDAVAASLILEGFLARLSANNKEAEK